MPNSDGLLFKDELKIGIDELQYLQLVHVSPNSETNRALRVSTMLTHGLVLPRTADGGLESLWRVSDDDDDGTIAVQTTSTYKGQPVKAAFVDAEGYAVVYDLDGDEIIALPNDATWYTITVQRLASEYEPGTLSLTAGSAVVNGTNTKFLQYSGYTSSGFDRGTKIRIDAADSGLGNAGTYEVDSIVSNTQLVLRAVIPGGTETINRFTVAGDFLNTTPADPDIHQRSVARIIRQGGVIREPAAGIFPLADVKRDDAGSPNVKIIDRRHQRQWRHAIPEGYQSNRGLSLSLPLVYDTTGGVLYPLLDQKIMLSPATVACVATSICPAENRQILSVVEDGGLLYSQITTDLSAVLGIMGSTGAATITGTQPALVRLPPGSGLTHGLLYINANILYWRSTANNGSTWSAATLVLDPTAIDVLDTVSYPTVILLLNGRIHVAMSYFDNSATQSYIVAANSDDFGATWDTDGGGGFLVNRISIPGVEDLTRPCLAQQADGTIYCTYQQDDEIGITATDDPSGEWPGVISLTGSPILTLMTPFDNLTNPVIFVSPDGPIGLIFQAYDAASQQSEIWFAILGEQVDGGRYCMMLHRTWIADNALTPVTDIGLSLCQLPTGDLALGYIETLAGAFAARWIRVIPTPAPYQEGGAQRYRAV